SPRRNGGRTVRTAPPRPAETLPTRAGLERPGESGPVPVGRALERRSGGPVGGGAGLRIAEQPGAGGAALLPRGRRLSRLGGGHAGRQGPDRVFADAGQRRVSRGSYSPL